MSVYSKDCRDTESAAKYHLKGLEYEPRYDSQFAYVALFSPKKFILKYRDQITQHYYQIEKFAREAKGQLPISDKLGWSTMFYDIEPDTSKYIHEIVANDVKQRTMQALTPIERQLIPFKHDQRFGNTNQSSQKSRLRIGYLGSCVFKHDLYSLMLPIYEFTNKSEFEIYFFSTFNFNQDHKDVKEMTQFLKYYNVWNYSDFQTAKLINDLSIDILVSLKGQTEDHRFGVFALQPASININLIAYPQTMGATYFQYSIADVIVVPSDNSYLITEKLILMPKSYYTVHHKYGLRHVLRSDSLKVKRNSLNISENTFIYSALNQHYKLDEKLISTWMRILQRVPNSILLLLDGGSQDSRRAFYQLAQKHNIAFKRIKMLQRVSHEEHVDRLHLADLALDTIFYNGHTTNCDCLWAGLPVLTLRGVSWARRVTSSLYHGLDMLEEAENYLITENIKDYEDMAVQLAKGYKGSKQEQENLSENIRFRQGSLKLKQLKQMIIDRRDRDGLLFDTRNWVKSYELALKTAWFNYINEMDQEDINMNFIDDEGVISWFDDLLKK
ncbi:UNKNOWN [Stylonychia lemnae]|uniref:O-GlcNAc transferase C-terminal domain-containing protein n=1 Tax=Stylonychia lemnae TaxID=5949 RepID=A0A077ZV72_STYLE|nr:UNKNOWN [Stylonychia lemnae]|eukprot:CDW73200.1 UNKNOWN [Stylonychia lemnae]